MWASLPGLVRPACGLAAVSGFRWADTSLGLGSRTRGVGLERVHGTADFILAFLDTEFGLLRVGFCFPPRLKNLPPTLVLRDWVLRGGGASAWVCEACGTPRSPQTVMALRWWGSSGTRPGTPRSLLICPLLCRAASLEKLL